MLITIKTIITINMKKNSISIVNFASIVKSKIIKELSPLKNMTIISKINVTSIFRQIQITTPITKYQTIKNLINNLINNHIKVMISLFNHSIYKNNKNN
jgi:ribosomal protein S19E (S16A)